MDWALIAPMVTAIVLIMTVGGVILLRPLARRLGDLLEAMARERTEGLPRMKEELARLRSLAESQSERMALLEERLDFTESLMEGERRGRLGRGPG